MLSRKAAGEILSLNRHSLSTIQIPASNSLCKGGEKSTKLQKYLPLGMFGAAGASVAISAYYFLLITFFSGSIHWKIIETFPQTQAIYNDAILALISASVFLTLGLSVRYEKIRKYVALSSLILSLVLLETSFLWTSGIIADYNIPIFNFAGVDYLMVSLFGIFAISLFYLQKSVIKVIQFGALLMLPLGIEVYLKLPNQFYVHVANFLQGTPLNFFNNFDLLISCLALFSVSTIYARLVSKK